MIRIADTFTDALARLTRGEQKAVKTTVFDLHVNPTSHGLRFHKLDRAKDKRFWSVRVSDDIRVIVHRSDGSMLVCYVDHHDAAYAWAERRKVEVHPTTGAAQLVLLRETVVEVPTYVPVPTAAADGTPPHVPAVGGKAKGPALAGTTRDELLGYGVPEEWVDDVLAATDESILDVAVLLPQEAAEAVLQLATGTKPAVPALLVAGADPFSHPDAQRRFRLVADTEELERALDAPWEKWTTFLHRAQREVATRRYSGPARVGGTAGTGKTVVALHRAAHLARENPAARVLVATFSITLARNLRRKLRHLVGEESDVARRISVDTVDDASLTMHERLIGSVQIATEVMIRQLIREAAATVEGHEFSDQFLFGEWNDVVDAWQLRSWEEYRGVQRLGRRTRLGEKQRVLAWQIFEKVRSRLETGAVSTPAMMLAAVTAERKQVEAEFDHVIVDEAQDVSVSQLKFLAALAGGRPDGLFFAGDLGQRIFQVPFSWRSLGVDVRGRSHTLRLNYRTSHQIRRQADRLLDLEIADVDGLVEDRRGVISAFDGPAPGVRLFPAAEHEVAAVGEWIDERIAEGIAPSQIAVFVRSHRVLERARAAIHAAGLRADAPLPGVDPDPACVVLLPMHLAKGLEFRAVAVMACDDDEMPHGERLASAADEAELEEIHESERHLLYVACTRARDRLLVTAVEPGSEFLVDLGRGDIGRERVT